MPYVPERSSMSLISAQALSVSFNGVQALHGVDFSIERGEIVTIVGPNGSGKSTFLRALLGIVPPTKGKVVRADNLKIGYVPQRLHIDAGLPLPVKRFLSLPVRRTDVEMAEVLAHVGVPGTEHQAMTTLSGGQFQRVLLARALLSRPDVLVLDEPTQGLDQPGVAAFYRLIEDVRRSLGCAVLSVSHDLHVVMSASDRVICLNGHICCEGTPRVVSNTPEYRALFGLGTGGALALYQHAHDHTHDHDHPHGHDHDHDSHSEGAI
jgi:zinc transport system ATP-binding protein